MESNQAHRIGAHISALKDMGANQIAEDLTSALKEIDRLEDEVNDLNCHIGEMNEY